MANLGDVLTANIYFYNDENSNGTGTTTDPQEEGTPNKSNPTASRDYLGTAAVMTVKQTASTLLNYGVSHVQMYTGSSNMQAKITEGVGLAKKAVNIGVAFAANPIMGIIQTLQEGLNLVLKIQEVNYKIQQDNRRTEQAIFRAGPNFNRSRM